MRSLSTAILKEQTELDRKPIVKISIQAYDFPDAQALPRFGYINWQTAFQFEQFSQAPNPGTGDPGYDWKGAQICCAGDGSLLISRPGLGVVRIENPSPDSDFSVIHPAWTGVEEDYIGMTSTCICADPNSSEVLVFGSDAVYQVNPPWGGYPFLRWGYYQSTDYGANFGAYTYMPAGPWPGYTWPYGITGGWPWPTDYLGEQPGTTTWGMGASFNNDGDLCLVSTAGESWPSNLTIWVRRSEVWILLGAISPRKTGPYATIPNVSVAYVEDPVTGHGDWLILWTVMIDASSIGSGKSTENYYAVVGNGGMLESDMILAPTSQVNIADAHEIVDSVADISHFNMTGNNAFENAQWFYNLLGQYSIG